MNYMTTHKLIIGDCTDMKEIEDGSVHLVVTSPPYFNAPFDYKELYETYAHYLEMLKKVAKELYRVMADGRIVALNIDDMLVDGEKFPIVADATRIFLDAGFRYRDRIIWKKPDGYLRISRRSGVLLQNPYPMYFYPDNLLESIIILQKGKFDYKSIPEDVRERSKIDVKEFEKQSKDWYRTLWEITNVLPNSELEKGIAAFPEELPRRLITLYSYVGETVLDPFAGSGTTMKIARSLNRNSIGIEIKKDLIQVIKKKIGFDGQDKLLGDDDTFEVIIRATKNVIAYGITAVIKGIQYTPFLCRELNHYKLSALPSAFKDATFFLDIDAQNKLAVSWWVSSKRTRSYPYARVYDSFGFAGKKLAIIPIMKDEGIEGDRDFLQWDTVSLMSLLGIYVIIAYYKDAVKSTRYTGKITEQ
ncbi:MAG: site-specific DNA-methyltransferase, partial [Candidatus Parvarchaeum sp.]